VVNQSRDKIIVYTRTIEDVNTLASLLSCDAYTSEVGDAKEKEMILQQ